MSTFARTTGRNTVRLVYSLLLVALGVTSAFAQNPSNGSPRSVPVTALTDDAVWTWQ